MALKSIEYKGSSFEISYEILNPHAGIDLIVLHGWGSNKGVMKQSFSKYMHGFRHIYIDLPGFGNSTNSMVLTTEDVSAILELFLQRIDAKKELILGHSFGGKVALLLNPEVLILVASAGIYIEKPLKIKAKIALFKLLKVFGLTKFRSLFIADDAKELDSAMYETFKNVVNEDFSDDFAKYAGKALLFWGKDDSATPLSSAKKIAALTKDSKLEVYEGDHYFFMQNAADISQKIEEESLKILGKTDGKL
jgi:pimeloyl-ACP methyl ester carboxylesterase